MQSRNKHELQEHSLVSNLYVKRTPGKKIWNIIKDLKKKEWKKK